MLLGICKFLTGLQLTGMVLALPVDSFIAPAILSSPETGMEIQKFAPEYLRLGKRSVFAIPDPVENNFEVIEMEPIGHQSSNLNFIDEDRLFELLDGYFNQHFGIVPMEYF